MSPGRSMRILGNNRSLRFNAPFLDIAHALIECRILATQRALHGLGLVMPQRALCEDALGFGTCLGKRDDSPATYALSLAIFRLTNEQKKRASAALADANAEARQRVIEIVFLAFDRRRQRTNREVG